MTYFFLPIIIGSRNGVKCGRLDVHILFIQFERGNVMMVKKGGISHDQT